ncbi:MAG: Glycosyl transferase group 1, partial [Candidatus Uhrbacteria bacterium GW2011_GWF2_46_218]
MRIFVDIRHLAHPAPSGVGEYTIQLLRTLFALSTFHEWILFSSGTTRPHIERLFSLPLPLTKEWIARRYERTVYPNGVEHIHLTEPNKILKLKIGLGLETPFTSLSHPKPDLLFLPNLNVLPKAEKTPKILMMHDLSWNLFPAFYSPRMRLWHASTMPHDLITSCVKILTPSHSTKQDLLKRYPLSPDTIETIPEGIAKNFQPTPDGYDDEVREYYRLPKRSILFLGTLEPRKNLRTVYEAIKLYRKNTGDDISFVLAGGWGWQTGFLRCKITKGEQEGWVRHLGYIPPEHRAALYRQAKVTLFPSLYEGFGLPVLESMACGTPVITSAISSLPEISGSAALLVDPYNRNDIVLALTELLSSPSLYQTLVQEGLLRSQKYTWEQTAKKTLEVFEKSVFK